MTLLERWAELSEKHGYCLESLRSIIVPQDEQKKIMSKFRNKKSTDGATGSEDYACGLYGLPPADVLKLYFTDSNGSSDTGAWAAIRPSGTEPKLKLYTGVRAKTYDEAKYLLNYYQTNLLQSLRHDIT